MNLAICQSCAGTGFRVDAAGDESICEVCQGDGCVDRRLELPARPVPPCGDFTRGEPAGWCIGCAPGCEGCARLAADICAILPEQLDRENELRELEQLRSIADRFETPNRKENHGEKK